LTDEDIAAIEASEWRLVSSTSMRRSMKAEAPAAEDVRERAGCRLVDLRCPAALIFRAEDAQNR
jgi:hypothetical protein